MKKEDFLDKINNEEFVLNEIKRLKYLFKVKGIIRFNGDKKEKWMNESVAEHKYSMIILCQYFFPFESKNIKMDLEKVKCLILTHDLPEIIDGDIITTKKTEKDRKREYQNINIVVNNSPIVLRDMVEKNCKEYESGKTNEVKFCKAIDRLDPWIHIFDEKEAENKKFFKQLCITQEHCKNSMSENGKNFPTIFPYYKAILSRWEKLDLF